MWVRTEEGSHFFIDMTSLENAWKILVCYAYRGVCLAVFQQDIVSWIILFDQAVFEQKCVFFCVYDRIRYVVNLRNKHLCLVSVYLFMEVWRYSSLQIFCLSYIYYCPFFIFSLFSKLDKISKDYSNDKHLTLLWKRTSLMYEYWNIILLVKSLISYGFILYYSDVAKMLSDRILF